MAEKNLETLFHDTLKDIYYAERTILKALPKMARGAQSPELKAAFQTHKSETEVQVERLQQVFEIIGKRAQAKTCPAIDGIIEEGEEILSEYKGTPALDAGLIASAQAVEHYEITRYGTLKRWAEVLGMSDVGDAARRDVAGGSQDRRGPDGARRCCRQPAGRRRRIRPGHAGGSDPPANNQAPASDTSAACQRVLSGLSIEKGMNMSASTTAGPTGTQVYDRPTAGEDAHTILVNRVSWGAIFAGVVVALVVQVLLTMLGVGIGVATLDPGAGDNPAVSTFSVVTGVWYVLSGIIAAFAGGYIAARMSGKTVATTGALHGLTTWAFTTLLVLYLLSTAVGGIVGGAFNGITSAVGGLGQTVAQTAAPIIAEANPLDAIENQVRASGNDPEALNAAATNAIRALVTGDEADADEARGQAAQALATARGIPLDQAQQQVAQMEEQYHQTVDQAQRVATETADTAASVVSIGALLAFVALVLGAVAGWLGGRSGVVHPVYADRMIPTRRSLA